MFDSSREGPQQIPNAGGRHIRRGCLYRDELEHAEVARILSGLPELERQVPRESVPGAESTT